MKRSASISEILRPLADNTFQAYLSIRAGRVVERERAEAQMQLAHTLEKRKVLNVFRLCRRRTLSFEVVGQSDNV